MAKCYIQDDTNYGYLVKGEIDGHVFYVDSCYTNRIHPDVEFTESEIPRLRELHGDIKTNIYHPPIPIYFSEETEVEKLCSLLSYLDGIEMVYATASARILGLWENGKLTKRRRLSDFYIGITEEEEKQVDF